MLAPTKSSRVTGRRYQVEGEKRKSPATIPIDPGARRAILQAVASLRGDNEALIARLVRHPHAGARIEAVELGEQLVERLLLLIVAPERAEHAASP